MDGEPVEGWSLEEIKKLTVGEEGTPCSLTLQRVHDKFEVWAQRLRPLMTCIASDHALACAPPSSRGLGGHG